MTQNQKEVITVRTTVRAPVDVVWKCWTTPEDIMRWNNASPDWHTPRAENHLHDGGRFNYRMEVRDGSAGFDFEGIYEKVVDHSLIVYSIADGRRVEITFQAQEGVTQVIESFEAEETHPVELQRQGWQAILANFKNYIETVQP